MRLCDVLYENEYTYTANRSVFEMEFENITSDVDKINNSTLFILMKSIKFDINKIINYVLNQTPKIIICDDDLEISDTKIPIVKVKSTRNILPYIYSRFYNIDYSKMTFVGVTGTNGKTTTATMIAHILKFAGRKVGFIGTGKISIENEIINENSYSMTTPDPELLYKVIKKMEAAGCNFVVMEVSSHAMYFNKVSPIPFKVSVFTNFSSEHMDFHNSMQEYLNCKLKLFKQSEIGIFNLDDQYICNSLKEISCKIKTIGINSDADVKAQEINILGFAGAEYIYKDINRIFKVNLKLPGSYNIYNSLLAAATCAELNIKSCVIKEGIETLTCVDGRFEIIYDNITVIIDYAHTVEAMSAILKDVNKAKKSEQKTITVFGCGGDRDRTKRPLMAKAAETNSDFVIVTSDNSRNESEASIIKDILSGFKLPAKHKVISSRKKAITQAILSAEKGDIVVIIGKGHERYTIDKMGYHEFDERKIINDALKNREE